MNLADKEKLGKGNMREKRTTLLMMHGVDLSVVTSTELQEFMIGDLFDDYRSKTGVGCRSYF